MNTLPFFGVSSWPGPQAATSIVEVEQGRLALSIHLDPIDWLLNIPPFPGGEMYMAQFLQQLSMTADDMAKRLVAQTYANETPRHAVREPDDTTWFSAESQVAADDGDSRGGHTTP